MEAMEAQMAPLVSGGKLFDSPDIPFATGRLPTSLFGEIAAVQ